MGLDKDGYYTLRDILGYNEIFNVVLSDRGRGKTYGTVNFLMEQEGRFMCVYRQEPDMLFALKTWLDPFFEKHPKENLEDYVLDGNKEGWTLTVKGVLKGYFNYLTQVNHIKQMKFPNDLNWIWWDEFIPMSYIKLSGVDSELDCLRVIMKTIDHDTAHPRESKGLKPLRVLMYANPFKWANPILSGLRINGLLGPGIHRSGPGVVWELLEPFKETEKRKPTVDDFLGNDVNKAMKFMRMDAFIEPFPKGLWPEYSIRINDHYYKISRGGVQKGFGRYYVEYSTEHIPTIRGGCFGTLDGMTEEETCIEDSFMKEMLENIIYRGRCVFKDINVKFDFINDVSYL